MAIESRLRGLRVLIVDDEEELRKAIAYDFRKRGCEVSEAQDGTEAFGLVRTQSFDIVVSDVRMPNGDGIELLKAIRSANPESPIVILATGFADLTEARALEIGALALLEKPIDRHNMIRLLENSASQRKTG